MCNEYQVKIIDISKTSFNSKRSKSPGVLCFIYFLYFKSHHIIFFLYIVGIFKTNSVTTGSIIAMAHLTHNQYYLNLTESDWKRGSKWYLYQYLYYNIGLTQTLLTNFITIEPFLYIIIFTVYFVSNKRKEIFVNFAIYTDMNFSWHYLNLQCVIICSSDESPNLSLTDSCSWRFLFMEVPR